MSDESLLKTSEKCKNWLKKLLGENSSVSPYFRAALDEIRAQVSILFLESGIFARITDFG